MNNDKRILPGVILAVIAVLLIFFIRPMFFTYLDTNKTDVSNVNTDAGDEQEGPDEQTEDQPDRKVTVYVSPNAKGQNANEEKGLRFRNNKYLSQHYNKHGIDMGFASAEEYEKAAAAVVANPAALHKTEAEDGDDIYYIEATNEFVVVSTDGYIRTYFKPVAGIKYYNKK